MTPKKISSPPSILSKRTVLNRILGCKWSVQVFRLLRDGTHRPGALEKGIPGISTKVLTDCLRDKVKIGLLERRVFPEIPPRVEYHFTELGARFVKVFSDLEIIQTEIDALASKPVDE